MKLNCRRGGDSGLHSWSSTVWAPLSLFVQEKQDSFLRGFWEPRCMMGLGSTFEIQLLPSLLSAQRGSPLLTTVQHLGCLLLLSGFEHKITVQASPTLDKRKGSDGASPPASPSIIPRLRAIRCEYTRPSQSVGTPQLSAGIPGAQQGQQVTKHNKVISRKGREGKTLGLGVWIAQ